jgi:predicted aspartyl protease
MLDTGASLTLVTKKWAADHGLRISEGKSLAVKGAGGTGIQVLGTTAFTV